jgi:hypothetical protein
VQVVAGLLMLPMAVQAETSVRPGKWEQTDSTVIDGQAEIPSPPKTVCVKPADATLEKLVMPSPDEVASRNCKATFAGGAGIAKATIACPASEDGPAINGSLDLKYSPTTYEGSGPIEFKMKDGTGGKGMAKLSGKRLGDC